MPLPTDNEVQRVQQLSPEQRAERMCAEMVDMPISASCESVETEMTKAELQAAIANAIREAEQAARQEEREAIAKLIRFMGSREYVGDGKPADAEELALSVLAGKRAPNIQESH